MKPGASPPTRGHGRAAADAPAGRLGDQDFSVALNPMVGVAREDLLRGASVLFQRTAADPRRTLGLLRDLASDAVEISTRKSTIAPEPKDKRFDDPTWLGNPAFKAGMQSYLALSRRVREWVSQLDLEPADRTRAAFVVGLILDALAPTNALATNPSALKKALETGGGSLVRGLRNAWVDLVRHDMVVSQVDRRPFKVGQNLAIQPGAVVHRSGMLELLHYTPTTAQVHDTPVLIVPPQINKAYINDLTPEKSVVKFLLDQGLQVFMVSWRNPGPAQRDWGLTAYVDELIAALDMVLEITGAAQVSLSGACSGGITTATLVSKLASLGLDQVRSVTLQVCVLTPEREDSELGALVSPRGIARARRRSAKKGVLSAASLQRTFAWLRPNDLVWNYVVNNYLRGEQPPAFDVLYWNDDGTNLSAALHSDYLRLYQGRPFAEPGRHELADHVVDLTKSAADVFIMAGITDHITPWKACYRAARLFGSAKVEFVLSQAGHIQAILNPPGNPKARYRRVRGTLPETAEAWLSRSEEISGSWWPRWAEWLKERSGSMRDAPQALGSTAHPPREAAPGSFVHG